MGLARCLRRELVSCSLAHGYTTRGRAPRKLSARHGVRGAVAEGVRTHSRLGLLASKLSLLLPVHRARCEQPSLLTPHAHDRVLAVHFAPLPDKRVAGRAPLLISSRRVAHDPQSKAAVVLAREPHLELAVVKVHERHAAAAAAVTAHHDAVAPLAMRRGIVDGDSVALAERRTGHRARQDRARIAVVRLACLVLLALVALALLFVTSR